MIKKSDVFNSYEDLRFSPSMSNDQIRYCSLATHYHDRLMDLARLASLIPHDNDHNSVTVKTMAK